MNPLVTAALSLSIGVLLVLPVVVMVLSVLAKAVSVVPQ